MNRFCFPQFLKPEEKKQTEIQNVTKEEEASDLINWSIVDTDKLITWIGDLYICWPLLLAAVVVCFILSLIYIFFVRFCASFIVYTTIILVLGVFIALGVFFYLKKDQYDVVNDTFYHYTMIGLFVVCIFIAFVWFIFICFMCNKIRLATAILEVTAKYISECCSIFGIPFLFFLLTVAWFAWWVVVSVYIYSTGEVNGTYGMFANIEWKNNTRYAFWFNFFALFYMSEFISAYIEFIYASAAGIWYFTHEKKTGNEKPISRSFRRGLRYHCGSLAFGALIIAIIRFLMFFFGYIKKKILKAAKKNEESKKKKAYFYRCLLCCCVCCCNCIQRTIEFINKHVYIEMALRGTSFCSSAYRGFGLIIRNLGRFSAILFIGTFFNIFGVIFISGASGLIGYLIITEIPYFADKINSPVLPTFAVVMIGLLIGIICMSTFGTSTDALIHCFLWDEEIHNGQAKSFPELQKFMTEEN